MSVGKTKKHKIKLYGVFNKIKPPTIDNEVEEVVEPWAINMNKYFQIYEYDDNLKARLRACQLQNKSIVWLEEVKMI